MLQRLVLGLALLLHPVLASACGGPIAAGWPIRLVAAQPGAAEEAEPGLRITFLGHASFLIETPARISVVTDYNGVYVPPFPPDIATMNHAHSTHYTDYPDPRIAHVLRGWRDDGAPPHIDLTLGDLHVTNLPTNTRAWGSDATVMNGNSIFVFASAGLCVAHLSHLHHRLDPDDIAALGPIDVVMAPVDNFLTLAWPDLAGVLDAIHARVVIPMHEFGGNDGPHFAATVRDRYDLVINPGPTVTLHREGLPARPEILVLPPAQ